MKKMSLTLLSAFFLFSGSVYAGNCPCADCPCTETNQCGCFTGEGCQCGENSSCTQHKH